MAEEGLDLRPAAAGPEHLADYSALLTQVFGKQAKFGTAALAWRYAHNPMGSVVGTDAWAGRTLCAHYVTCPLDAQVEGRQLRGLVSLNTATHPDWRGKGLFTQLALETYVRAAAARYDFVIGVANGNSTPGFVRHLGFQLVRPLQAGVLARTPKAFSDAPVQFEGVWSTETLHWRMANPAARYRSARSGELTAVWTPTAMPGLNCVAFLHGRGPDGRKPRGASLWMGLEPRLDLRVFGYAPLPTRLRPSPLNLIYRPLSERAPAQLDPELTAFNFLDFDPY